MTLHLTLLYTVSTDGFIATSDHGTPWLASSWQDYLTVCRQFRHLVMGRKTFELLEDDPTVNRADFESITVLSRTLQANVAGVTTAPTPRAAITQLVERNVSRALLVGGSEAATSFLRAGLISEIHLDRNPIILGEGIHMFREMPGTPKIRLQSCVANAEGRLHEVYEVINES
jgi:dihydrofolate reductase